MSSKSNKNPYNKLRYRAFIIPRARALQKRRIAEVREAGRARVAFIVSSLSMWRLERVYRIMESIPERFDPAVVLIPFASYSPEEQQKDMAKAREYFAGTGMKVLEADSFKDFDPDIVFYPQFYRRPYAKGLNPADNENRLLCYSPYGIMLIDEPWQYNHRLHNVAWKLYLQSGYYKGVAEKLSFNKGANAVIVGEADYDEFAGKSSKDVWKPQETPKKRVIWAPHHSFGEANRLGRDSFLWTAEEMKRIAAEYSDRVQFAFKPHPRLFSELCKRDDWGVERAKAFYDFWAESPNTQYDNEWFVDLFKGSDAMIHDCNSFIAEYMYTAKPVLFLTRNIGKVRSGLNAIGNKALDASFIGDSPESVREFLDRLLCGAVDTKKELREGFRKEFLSPANAEGFAGGVVEDIRRSLWD